MWEDRKMERPKVAGVGAQRVWKNAEQSGLNFPLQNSKTGLQNSVLCVILKICFKTMAHHQNRRNGSLKCYSLLDRYQVFCIFSNSINTWHCFYSSGSRVTTVILSEWSEWSAERGFLRLVSATVRQNACSHSDHMLWSVWYLEF